MEENFSPVLIIFLKAHPCLTDQPFKIDLRTIPIVFKHLPLAGPVEEGFSERFTPLIFIILQVEKVSFEDCFRGNSSSDLAANDRIENPGAGDGVGMGGRIPHEQDIVKYGFPR